MISFDQGNNRFNYRVVGVVIHKNSVLLHQGEGDSFWIFPGGRAELGESAEQTLRREMKEELGIEVEITIELLEPLAQDRHLLGREGERLAGP